MELISKDEAMRRFKPFGREIPKEQVMAVLARIDEGIVRCGECEWWQKQDDSLQGRCAKYEFYPTGRYFCAGGERSEE